MGGLTSKSALHVWQCSPAFHVFVAPGDARVKVALTIGCCCVQATFYALQATYGWLSPELWTATRYTKSPMQEFTDFLAKPTLGDVKPVQDFPGY